MRIQIFTKDKFAIVCENEENKMKKKPAKKEKMSSKMCDMKKGHKKHGKKK